MLMWNGACVVHEEFKGIELGLLREEHPDALVLVHPESPESVVAQADVVGSTSQLLKAVVDGDAREYIVATDNGIFHRMRQLAPGKTLIEAPTAGDSATCKSCAHCPWMAMNDLQGVIDCAGDGRRRDPRARSRRASRALGCIERMLAFVAANPDSIVAAGARVRAPPRLGLRRRRGRRSTPLPANETLEEARARNVRDALREDVGTGDWTARLVPPRPVTARVRVREEAVLCGRDWFEACVRALDGGVRVDVALRRGRRHGGRHAGLRGARRRARAAHGRASGAQLPAAALGHGHGHPAPRPGDRGRLAEPARLRRPRHAQDDPGPAPGAEVRRPRRRRERTSASPCGTAS